MLTIVIPPVKEMDIWDQTKEEFIHINGFKGCTLILEHSLISISKWEAKWHVPFIGSDKKTEEQTLHYIKCMTINQGISDEAYDHLSVKDITDISNYINDPMTASKIKEVNNQGSNRETVTSDLIYYWMIALQIPFECEKWHLNRLLQLVTVCNVKSTPPKKLSKSEIIARNREINRRNREKYHSKG